MPEYEEDLREALVGSVGEAETVNTFFAWLFALLVPFGMLEDVAQARGISASMSSSRVV